MRQVTHKPPDSCFAGEMLLLQGTLIIRSIGCDAHCGALTRRSTCGVVGGTPDRVDCDVPRSRSVVLACSYVRSDTIARRSRQLRLRNHG